MSRSRAVTKAVATIGALAAAAVLWQNLPTPTDVYAPFTVEAVLGSQVSGRDLSATVRGVRIAPELQADSVLTKAPIAAVGVWVAVDTTLLASTDPALPRAELIVGADIYRPTDRIPAGTALGGPLQPSISVRGAWVFDVAPALLGPDTVAVLSVSTGDGRLDSRLDIRIPLDDSDVTRSTIVDLARPAQEAT